MRKENPRDKTYQKRCYRNCFCFGSFGSQNTYTLKAQTDGYLSAVNFEEGNFVNAGKILAIVDNKESGLNQESAKELYNIAQNIAQNNAPALLQAQNAINLNEQKMEQDYMQYQRYKKLWESNSIAKIDFENAELQYKTVKSNYESSLENYKQLKTQANQQVIKLPKM